MREYSRKLSLLKKKYIYRILKSLKVKKNIHRLWNSWYRRQQ